MHSRVPWLPTEPFRETSFKRTFTVPGPGSGARYRVMLLRFSYQTSKFSKTSEAAIARGLPAGSSGCFTFINNTTDYAVTGFDVGNNGPVADSTTRPNWAASITDVNYGSGPEASFAYADQGGSLSNPITQGSDSRFFYTTSLSGSPFRVTAVGPAGVATCVGSTSSGCMLPTPEPSALSVLSAAMLALGWLRRRRLDRGVGGDQI